MLLAWLLCAFLILARTVANLRDPFVYRNYKPVTRMKPVIVTEANDLLRPPYENTFTAKPVNEPVITETGFKKTYMEIPAYIVNSVEVNNSVIRENGLNIKDLFSNVEPKQVKEIQLPILEDVIKQPMDQNIVPNIRLSESLQNQLQVSTEKNWIDNNNLLSNDEGTLFNSSPLLTNDVVNAANEFRPNESFFRDKIRALFPNSQFPVLTEKPVYEQKFVTNKDRIGQNYVPFLPVLNRKPVNAPINMHKERLLKEKLLSLFKASTKDVANQIRNTQSIHDTFKSGTMYKIGYVTSLINKMNDRIKYLYKTVQDNHNNWDSLKLLDAYEQMKRDNETIQQLLYMMQSYLRVNGKTGGGRQNPSKDVGISWSYYDDSMP